jgi:probable HAF family extracellular repeat protein
VINTVADLENISNNLSGHYVMGRNIDAYDFYFAPIGTASNPFTGTLDGNGYTITNLSINETGNSQTGDIYGGLFGFIGKTGIVQNINLTNLSIPSNLSGFDGGLAGQNEGTIQNVSASLSGGFSPNAWVGGLVGNNVGGTIFQCSATGPIGDGAGPYGALSIAGGLVGYNQGTIDQSYWVASAATSQTQIVPGLTAYSEPDDFVGLGQGSTDGTGLIEDSYAIGPITTPGLVGTFNQDGIVTNSYATGLGGVVGINYQGGAVTNSYWVTSDTGQVATDGGTEVTPAEIQTGALPSGLDPTVWAANQGQYPSLSWQFGKAASSNGTYSFSTFDDPLTNETFVNGINDVGRIVGRYFDSSGFVHGFLYDNGAFTPLDDLLASFCREIGGF